MRGSFLLSKENITIPNLLSLVRIALIIPFISLIINDNLMGAGATLMVSGISDLLDGFIARKFDQRTRLGAMLDPAADKLTLMSVMICVGIKFPEVIPFVSILILKELSMLIASAVLIKMNKVPTAAKWYGKIGTVAFYVSVTIIVSLKAVWNIENHFITVALMSITALLMLYALIKYLKIFISMMKSDKYLR